MSAEGRISDPCTSERRAPTANSDRQSRAVTGRRTVQAADTLSGVSSPTLLAWRPDPAGDSDVIERHLRACTDSGDRSLTSIAAISTAEPRPRERAAATIVAATLLGAADADASLADDVVDIAVAVELVEVGTECHDDVIAQVTTRDGRPTANHVHGDLQAILAGDFLIARASELAAAHGTEIASELATTIGWLCEGRQRELDAERDTDTRLANLELRTARLFSSAMRIGALFAGADGPTADRLGTAGSELGMALAIEADARRFAEGDPSIGRSAVDELLAGRWTIPATLVGGETPNDRAGWTEWHTAALAGGVVESATAMAADRRAAAVDTLATVADHPLLATLRPPVG